MSAAELVPLIDALPRLEKFQLLQFLVSSITKEENITPLDPSITYPMWTPYDTPTSTTNVLAAMLVEDSNVN